MKGHPIRGFLAGILLGIVLDLDLFLGGVVKSDATALTIVPIVCIVLGFLLGLWAPIGRRSRAKKMKEPMRPVAAPLPQPVAWPEAAPVEGSNPPAPGSWKAPPGPKPPEDSGPIAPPTAPPIPPVAPQSAPPTPPPPAQSI
jgi:hypothetical protein